MSLPIGAFRPNTAKVERMTSGGTSGAGDQLPAAPATIYTGLPCLIDTMPKEARLTEGRFGPIVEQIYTLYSDAVSAAGKAAGATVTATLGGVGFPFIVDPNGRNAFADIKKDDRITREDGTQFLVIAVVKYYDVFPGLQAHLRLGPAWG